jgi:hypothetical protein
VKALAARFETNSVGHNRGEGKPPGTGLRLSFSSTDGETGKRAKGRKGKSDD